MPLRPIHISQRISHNFHGGQHSTWLASILPTGKRRTISSAMRLSNYPLDLLLRKRRSLRRELLSHESLASIRIAILGGSTTHELIELFELFLLDAGFQPTFYESPYGQYYETAVLHPKPLIDFGPNIVYIHTCSLNLQPPPL